MLLKRWTGVPLLVLCQTFGVLELTMNLRCKPGDLAIVVDAYNPANIGTIVRVIRVHPNQGAMCKEP
jgi:hypothetical protein